MAEQADLFDEPGELPGGLLLRTELLSRAEERALLEQIGALPLREAEYKQWTAKRRTASFGGRYDISHGELLPAPPIPDFLWPLRERLAAWLSLEPQDFTHALVAEYRPGTQLGWHRDVPDFEAVAGVSLGGRARMRLRRYPPRRGERASIALELAPRSAYALLGAARWEWQHAISPTKELRYSITFRTLRRGGPAAAL
jgi:alkylated DNA repair dioxygenase AlkB